MAEAPTTRPCPVCGERRAEVLHAQRFVLADDKKLAGSYNVVACVPCGAAFADTPVTQREYDELYARRSRYAAGPAAHAAVGDRDVARFRDMAAEIAAVVPEKHARMLDVGCANGQMLAALAERGYTSLTGVDPSPACVQQASAIPGASAFVGSLSEMPVRGRIVRRRHPVARARARPRREAGAEEPRAVHDRAGIDLRRGA